MEYSRNNSIISPKTQTTSPSFQQLLREEDAWTSGMSPTFGRTHDHEEYHLSPTNNNKKSVLAKVKEKAKKLRHTLSGKNRRNESRTSEDNNSTPSWGVTLDDDDDDDDEDDYDEKDEDPEYLGAPMYESEAAPETYKEAARQHPREINGLSPKAQQTEQPKSPTKTITETVTEKLAPAYLAMSDATHTIASKLSSLTLTNTTHPQETFHNAISPPDEDSGGLTQLSPQIWDKGVSIKEYVVSTFKQGEVDENELISEAIAEAVSPTKRSGVGDTSFVEKVKGAVSSFIWIEQPNNSIESKAVGPSLCDDITQVLNGPSSARQHRVDSFNAPSSANVFKYKSDNYSSMVQGSTNTHEVIEEENHGRVLQTN